MLQAFVERRKGGESGIAAVQGIQGPETWKWTEHNHWAAKLLDAIRTRFECKPGHFQESIRNPGVTIVDYRDGTKSAVYNAQNLGWTYAGDIAGQKDPTIVSMLGWPGPYSQYHAANAFEHWLVERMLTRKEPYNAERLLLSTGITSYNMESNWENGHCSGVDRPSSPTCAVSKQRRRERPRDAMQDAPTREPPATILKYETTTDRHPNPGRFVRSAAA